MPLSKEVRVTQVVKVTIDESKFTPAFMQEFREYLYPFFTIERHLEHLGQLYARGIASDFSFIEGYGPAMDMGIKFEDVAQEQELLD
jgi:hypothetical protein